MVKYIVSNVSLFIIFNELSVHEGKYEKKDEKRAEGRGKKSKVVKKGAVTRESKWDQVGKKAGAEAEEEGNWEKGSTTVLEFCGRATR